MNKRLIALAALAAVAGMGTAHAKDAADGIAEYRAMLADGNPAELYEMNGEELWKAKRGPKNASLEQCDLGKGPGVVAGAFVELPRYFADTKKVMDLETRIKYCMETLQGVDTSTVSSRSFVKGLTGDITAIATWVGG